ncbi:MAG: molybdopterin molybdotransferase MoeA [Bacteroidales bacterium]|nr:molybdopterin molybdotransferase MoeA [Bacteroidales bacterium]MCF8455421.1 molybdopterin molybdotransferase MoeA [Bacteroidales bacterium]
MIEFRDALNICLQSANALQTERIGFMRSRGRILAENVVSDIDMPPFDKTAVDGYACRRADLSSPLEVLELIPAGVEPTKVVEARKCSKIMTGARVPDGADCVIMVEEVEEIDEKHIRFIGEKTANNICYLAEDVKLGSQILPKGTLIKPQDIAMFASVGYVEPMVYKQPRVAVISTGNELVEPDQKPGLSKIRNSNAYQLLAQVENLGAIANYMGIAEDSDESLFSIITRAKEENDVILLTGGVSMGDFDLVPKMLKETGFEIQFKSIAIQPGRPTLFGKQTDKYVFGLPGNPVSSFSQFELLVKPFLYKLMGYTYQPNNLLLPLAEDYSRKRADREKWIPAVLTENGELKPTGYHGSAHIHALSFSGFMFQVPIGVDQLKKGAKVHVRSI